MQPLTEREVRASFVNASKGEVQRLNLPPELDSLTWGEREFLGWIDAMAAMSVARETLSVEERVARLRRNVLVFVERVLR